MDELIKRKLHRLKNFDYSQNGYYFVTICTKGRKNILGYIEGNTKLDVLKIIPNKIGEDIIKCWNKMSEINPNIKTEYFCIMPNHIHGIIIIQNQLVDCDETEHRGRRSL